MCLKSDFISKLADVNTLPGVRDLVRLRSGEGDHHLALTHWILSSKSFAVKTLQREEVLATNGNTKSAASLDKCCFVHSMSSYLHQYAKLCDLTEYEGTAAPVPDFLFELEYSDHINSRFEKTREERGVFYAFHGSRLENFHSIVHNGLHCHLNKVTAEDNT